MRGRPGRRGRAARRHPAAAPPRRQPLRGAYGWYFRRVLPKIGQLLARNRESAYDYLPESVGQFPQYEQLVQRMEAAGLGEVKFHPFTLGVATLYVGAKRAK